MTCYEKDFGRGRLAENRSSKTFIKFHIDVGVGDAWIEPHDEIKLYDWLDFAGISSLKIPIISAEQHFAEKIHAYTLPRSGAFNSRVKDLVDIVLLIKHGKIKKTVLTKALKETFEKKRTHDLPKTLDDPPSEWDK